MKKCLLLTAVVFLGTFTAAIAQVPSYVPTDGLVGWWPFNGNANDESGNGNDGVVNGAALTEDRFGDINAAYFFDGGSSNISIPHSNSLAIIGDITISVWKKSFGNTGSYETFVNKRGGNGEWNYSLGASHYFGPGGCPQEVDKYVTGRRNNGGSQFELRFSDYLVSNDIDEWINIILAITSDTIQFYVNGNLVGNSCFGESFSIPSIDVGAPLTMGSCNCGLAEFFYGYLDDIAIYNRALTEQEIQALYIGCSVAPTTIAGNLSPATLTSTTYACNNNPGSTFQWTVTNGVITAGQGTSNVTVLWGEEGIGTLSVVETNAEGCSGATSTIDVTVICATTATTIDGPLGPNALTSTTYTCNGVAGSSYQWTISNGVITSGQGTNSVNVLWAVTGLGTISVQETTNVNCEGDVLSLDVVVIPTSVEEEQDLSIAIFPNPASNEVTLTASEGLRGKIYTIFSSTGQAVMTGALSIRTVIDLQGLASGTYTVVVDGAVRKTLSVVHE